MTAGSSSIDAACAPSQVLHLLYHEVRTAQADYSYAIDAATFQRHLDVCVGLSQTGPIRPEITFDDGHVSNIDTAAPALESRGLTARFFITAGWIGRSSYMNWAQISQLHRIGHHIGAHGWSHQLLTHCGDAQLQTELDRSRRTIEDKLGVPVTTMSLPGGRADRRVLSACRKAGYTHIFTSEPRVESSPLPFTIGRVNVLGSMQAQLIAQLFERNSAALGRLHTIHQVKSALKALLGDRLYEKLWATLNRAQFDPAAERETTP